MKISDIQLGKRKIVEVTVKDRGYVEPILPLTPISIIALEHSDNVHVRIGGKIWIVSAADDHHKNLLDSVMERNLPRIAWVISSRLSRNGETSSLLIEIREFPSSFIWSETVEIGVDEEIRGAVEKKTGSVMTLDGTLDWLDEKFLAKLPDGEDFILLSGSPNTDKKGNNFRIHGNGFVADLFRNEDDNEKDQLLLKRIVQRRHFHDEEQFPVILVQGDFRFVDQTIAGAFRGSARSQLEQLMGEDGSYLKLWKEYNELERQKAYAKARAFGWMHYGKRYLKSEGVWCFELNEKEKDGLDWKIQFLQEERSISLEVAERLPDYLKGTLFDNGGNKNSFVGEFLYMSKNNRTLELRNIDFDREDNIPPEKGFIFVGLSGSKKQSERREMAQKKITSAECPMPQLGLLMEGKPVPERRRKKERPLSAAVREAFGGMEPTGRQIEALNVALNTPDIALIQGPPGTGKTRIIAALLSRLAEINADTQGFSGRYLLASTQHDAVENVADATQVFGLPASKIGRKRGKSEDADGFERWKSERIERVREQLSEFGETPIEVVFRRFRNRMIGYIRAPLFSDNLVEFLDDILGDVGEFIPAYLADGILEMRQRFQFTERVEDFEESDDIALALMALRSLRTDSVSFAYDGARQAAKVLRRLNKLGILNDSTRETLTKAAQWEGEPSLTLMVELEKLQSFFIKTLHPDKKNEEPSINQDLIELLNKILDALKEKIQTSESGIPLVLHEYLDGLENDVVGAKDAVKHYTAVLASTCQQAVSVGMEKLKSEGMVFETVVVDEAARANPLDLFIPMSLAERRIVLVGDHRQLPHLLEPEISREIEKSLSEESREMLDKSLFEHLFKMMREREKMDGIKRTVTLNVQYRMHPILGAFVSNTFYKPHGESFESILEANQFIHNLKKYGNSVAVWVDIPLERGAESDGVSKKRVSEAKWIAKETNEILSEGPDLSVGVISFYAEQVHELYRQMEPLGLVERLEDGSYKILEAWRTVKGMSKERLRIGTVDSFQGKEFDVVILSMTRSNAFTASDDKGCRRKFGHLMLENRLCVAMSRQQRLLIVAGDSTMLKGEAASGAIGGLCKFYELCGGPHGRIIQA